MSHSRLVYIALGANVGDRAAAFARAIDEMNRAGLRVRRQSSLYATQPVGGPPQGWFLNAVVEVETDWMPLRVLHTLQRIERSLGRHRSVSNGPRTLDLDMLFYGTSIIRSRELEVPHPRLPQRCFVLAPLAELAPTLSHPAFHKTIAELLAENPDGGLVQKWKAGSAGFAGDEKG
jgi:2-amino-4-hydroxy-6-hydroxymethyldihydropteridine diphosphokinase